MEDYANTFIYFGSSSFKADESILLDFFINGLQENHRTQISVLRDCFLYQSFPLVRDLVHAPATRIAFTMEVILPGR